VASRLGHASGATTMKVYAHRTVEADQRASEIVGDILDGT
jgi:integrase